MEYKNYLESQKDEIIALMRDYLGDRVAVIDFRMRIGAYRRKAIEESDRLKARWPRRYDIELSDSFTRGEITREQFHQKHQELLRYSDVKWLELFDSVYSDLDRLELDAAALEESRNDPNPWTASYHMDETKFKQQIKKYVSIIDAWPKD